MLRKSALYCIIDRQVSESVFRIAAQIKKTGCRCIVQYRDKISPEEEIIEIVSRLRRLLRGPNTVFIVNDYPEVVRITDADGLHIGQDDQPIEAARRVLGEDKIIGVSTHSLRQAIAAQEKRADYIGIGPVFRTSTKPGYKPLRRDVIKAVSRKIEIPVFAIGGISEENIGLLPGLGIKQAAVCKAVCRAGNIREILRKFPRNNRLSYLRGGTVA